MSRGARSTALVLLLTLLGCRSKARDTRPQAGATSASASASAGSPGRFAPLREWALAEARGLEATCATLAQAADEARWGDARTAYAEARRRSRRLDPLVRRLAPLASSQLGAYNFFEPEEANPLAGLGAVGGLLRAPSPDQASLRTATRKLQQAARLLPGELATHEWIPREVGHSLSEGVYVLGARLDGSDSFDEDERWRDARAEVEGLGEVLARTGIELSADDRSVRDRALGTLVAMTTAPTPRPSMLAALDATAQLGALVRRTFEQAGSPPLASPFKARHDRGLGRLAPVSALTFPMLPGAPPDAADVALGRALFSSTLLSRTHTVACASCHDAAHGYAHADPPTVTFDRKVPPRNAPGLWNAAYEPFLFWDGRASTLENQIDVAVDRDMGGDWPKVVQTLAADPAIAPLAGPEPLTPARVRHAIVAFERTLIEDGTRLDRAVRGELALDPDESRGLDLFAGKARCSRCHRPPLLSGTVPPRFLRAELSSIGPPTRPDGHSLGTDTGRHEASHEEGDRGMFKAPGLRRVAETAPYFHHGGFRTLEQVVDFYVKGGGPGLGIDVPNVDPELRPVDLSPAERADLLVFLRRTLSR